MNCPRCSSDTHTKDGIVKNRQRYRCKNCGYRYTIDHLPGKDSDMRRQALELYLEGLGFRSIGRFLRVSHVTVYQWIRAFGDALKPLQNTGTAQVMELDEMHSYIGEKKNACWLWIAVDRDGKKFLACVVGCRGAATGRLLWREVEDLEYESVMTDYWKSYEEFVPKERHVQSKAETFCVEGYNSLLRHWLARMRRKSKCYSKSVEMLLYSVLLLMAKWNGELEAILN